MSTNTPSPRIALVHDELTRRGGAEAVLTELLRLYPAADLYALYAGRPSLTVDGKQYPVRTTFLQYLPAWFRQHPRRLLPLLPYAAEQLDLSAYNLVISSVSGFAKGIVTRANVPHICYCHTPTRYLWDAYQETIERLPRYQRPLARLLFHGLRLTDYASAQRVDHYVANSQWTQQRIQTFYGRPSTVVYPPVATHFFTPTRAGERRHFLCVGRLTASKRFEQAVAVCEKLSLPLIVVGRGDQERSLRRIGSSHTQFVGSVDRTQLRQYYRSAWALLQPAEEDFGLSMAESLACGTPVIAYGVGGSREIVESRATGILYDQPTVESLAEAIRQFLDHRDPWPSERLQSSVLRFSQSRFQTAMTQLVERVLLQTVPISPYSRDQS